MTKSELKMLADHMGHDVSIHMDVYKLQCSLIEKAKVARILIANENGLINKFKGKKLEDINIDGKTYILVFGEFEKCVAHAHCMTNIPKDRF